MRCPSCQHENPSGQKFCRQCGARLAAVCANCGAANSSEQKFCGECGASLGQDLAKSKFESPQAAPPCTSPNVSSFQRARSKAGPDDLAHRERYAADFIAKREGQRIRDAMPRRPTY